MRAKNSSTCGAIGAAPEIATRTRSRPSFSRSARNASRCPIRPPRASATRQAQRLMMLASAMRTCTPASIFSQTRGTPRKTVGWTSRMSAPKVSPPSPKLTV